MEYKLKNTSPKQRSIKYRLKRALRMENIAKVVVFICTLALIATTILPYIL